MVAKDANERELLTVGETAQRMRQHPSTIYRKIERGELPALRLGDGRAAVRVDADELDAWLYGKQEPAA